MASFNNATETASAIQQYFDCQRGDATIEGLTVKKRGGRIEYNITELFTTLITEFHADPSSLTMQIVQNACSNIAASLENSEAEGERAAISEEEVWNFFSEIVEFRGGNVMVLNGEFEGDYFTEVDDVCEIDMHSVTQIFKKIYTTLRREHIMPYPLAIMCDDIPRRLEQQLATRKATVMSELAYDPEAPTDGLDKLVGFLETEHPEEDVKSLKHLIWNVKRKAIKGKTYDQVFPVFVGGKGIGKSVAAKWLANPIGEFFQELELKDISEERSIANDSAQNMLMLFDEMASAERASIQHLKRWVTADELTVRVMRSNHRVTKEKIAQGLGTSNDDLQDILSDKTGNRRFYQITCQRKASQKAAFIDDPEYAEGSQFWLDIWRSIDENLTSGFWNPSVDLKILSVMSQSVSQNAIELFLEEYIDWTITYDDDQFVFVRTDDIFASYKNWTKESQNRSTYTKHNFARKLLGFLKDIDPRCKAERSGNKRGYILPSKEAAIKKTSNFATRSM
jgi:hypothetical protein